MEKYKWSSNGRFIGIIRLSAKGTDGVMKPEGVLSPLKIVCYTVHGGVRQTTQTVEVSGGAV